MPKKQPKRRRLWLNDGSCIRLRPERPGHVWSYDFVEDITHNGRKYRMLNIIDEFSRECLALVPLRRFRSDDVLAVLADFFVEHGPPEHVRSDNGPEFGSESLLVQVASLVYAAPRRRARRRSRLARPYICLLTILSFVI